MGILRKYQTPNNQGIVDPTKQANVIGAPSGGDPVNYLEHLDRQDYKVDAAGKIIKNYWGLSPFQAQMVDQAHNIKTYVDPNTGYRIMTKANPVGGGGTAHHPHKASMSEQTTKPMTTTKRHYAGDMAGKTTIQTAYVGEKVKVENPDGTISWVSSEDKPYVENPNAQRITTTGKREYTGTGVWSPSGGVDRMGGRVHPNLKPPKDYELLPTSGNVEEFKSKVVGVFDSKGNPIENYDFSGMSAVKKNKKGSLLKYKNGGPVEKFQTPAGAIGGEPEMRLMRSISKNTPQGKKDAEAFRNALSRAGKDLEEIANKAPEVDPWFWSDENLIEHMFEKGYIHPDNETVKMNLKSMGFEYDSKTKRAKRLGN